MSESNTRNLWGELENVSTIPMPIAILKEQAKVLGEITNNVLRGEVIHHTNSGLESNNAKSFNYLFRIYAPFLDDYKCDLIRVEQPLTIYPLIVYPLLSNKVYNPRFECRDEKEFIEALEKILQSDEVKKVISLLRSHANK